MEINKYTRAGTLQSNDCLIHLYPPDQPGKITVEIDSPVLYEFGEQIKKCVLQVLADKSIEGCRVKVEDRGALDCTLAARTKTAVERAL